MKTRMIALGLVALAGCGKSDDAANNTAIVAPAAPIQPGLYRQATTLIELKDPGLDAEQAAAAAKAVGTTQTADRCVTPAMVENPREIVASSVKQGCSAQKSVWDAGKIDIAMTCPETEETSAGTMTLTGTYGAEAYAMDMAMSGEEGEVMRMKVEAKRLGDCK